MPDDAVTIAFLGDIYLGETSAVSLSPSVLEVLGKADLVVANQEGPITDADQAVGGKICLKSAVASGSVLRDWGVDAVSLANNHMFDYGWEGFQQTRATLDRAGVTYLGAGENLAEALRPLILSLGGMTIGMLACSWGVVETTCAKRDAYGCAPLDSEMIVAATQELASRADVAIVIPHWGYCDYVLPPPEMVSLGNSLLDAGATAVVGHHSHVLHGIVRRGHALIAYSLGNFSFADYASGGRTAKMSSDNRKGAVLSLRCQPGKVASHDITHTMQRGDRIELDDSRRREKELARRSAPLAAHDYEKRWRRYLRWRLVKRLVYWANILNWRRINRTTIRGGRLLLGRALKLQRQA